jgi:hypothetical protein
MKTLQTEEIDGRQYRTTKEAQQERWAANSGRIKLSLILGNSVSQRKGAVQFGGHSK